MQGAQGGTWFEPGPALGSGHGPAGRAGDRCEAVLARSLGREAEAKSASGAGCSSQPFTTCVGRAPIRRAGAGASSSRRGASSARGDAPSPPWTVWSPRDAAGRAAPRGAPRRAGRRRAPCCAAGSARPGRSRAAPAPPSRRRASSEPARARKTPRRRRSLRPASRISGRAGRPARSSGTCEAGSRPAGRRPCA